MIKVTKKKRKRGIDCEKDQAFDNDKLKEIIHDSGTVIDLNIYLHECQYPVLAERLYKDVQNREFCNVFGNEALKSPPVLQNFIEILKKKSYNDLYNLLMLELKYSEVQRWTNEFEEYGVEEKKDMNLRTNAYQFIIDKRFFDHQHTTLYSYRSSVRGIKWVIFFGHYPIFEYILNQMIQEKGNVQDLFLTCFNKHHQTNLNMNLIETGTEEDPKAVIDTDNETENCTNNDVDFGIDNYLGSEKNVDADSSKDSDSYSEIACDTYDEPLFV